MGKKKSLKIKKLSKEIIIHRKSDVNIPDKKNPETLDQKISVDESMINESRKRKIERAIGEVIPVQILSEENRTYALARSNLPAGNVRDEEQRPSDFYGARNNDASDSNYSSQRYASNLEQHDAERQGGSFERNNQLELQHQSGNFPGGENHYESKRQDGGKKRRGAGDWNE